VAPQKDEILGRLAVERGVITGEQLAALRKEQEAGAPGAEPRPLGELLLEKGLVGRKDLDALLEEQGRRDAAMAGFQKLQKVEYLFGQLLVKNNLATQLQVNKCLEVQIRLAERGTSPIPRLGELLVEHGFVDRRTVARILRMQDKDPLACPACGKQVNVPSSEEGRTHRCPGCGAPLIRPLPLDSIRAEDASFGSGLPSEDR